MKNYCIAIISLLLLSSAAGAQIPFKGRWVGALSEIRSLKMSFNITEEGDTLKATMDVPTQGAKDMACTHVTVKGDSVAIDVKKVNGRYEGKLADINQIEGMWIQNGMSVPLKLTRTEGAIELNRPQTPKAPFSYNSEDVLFYSADKNNYFGATITTPRDNDKHPAIIMITGSGPQNRDEEIFGHKPFAVVADYLTKQGYVVLRVDDRGVGKTGGDRTNATSADFAKDVQEAIGYLKTRKEVDRKRIGLYGHSEGGMIAQMVAAENKDIHFIILMAAPGIKVTEAMTEQNVAYLQTAGISKEVAEQYGKLYRQLAEGIATSHSMEEASTKLTVAIDKWLKVTEPSTAVMTTGIKDSASKRLFVGKFIEQTWNKWTVYFMQYDPQPVLQKLSCKVLALNGDKDFQVISRSNLEGIQQALTKSKSKSFEVREITGVNHLFQECNTCTMMEYGELEQTIKPEVMQTVATWLDNNVK